jgi:hypothetical protein
MKTLRLLFVAASLGVLFFPDEARSAKEPAMTVVPSEGETPVKKDIPNLDGRPFELRPGNIPDRVTYKFGDDAKMIETAQSLRRQFLDDTVPATPLFDSTVKIQPGAWKALNAAGVIGKKSNTPTGGVAKVGRRTLRLEGMIIRDKDERLVLEKLIRDMVRKDGGGVVRAMRTSEMDKWWTFIAFDIEEPTLVLETKKQKHLFVFYFDRFGVVVIDELNGLPE